MDICQHDELPESMMNSEHCPTHNSSCEHCCRSPHSCVNSRSSVRLLRRMRNHAIHCSKRKPPRCRPGAGIQACPCCRPGPGSEAPPLIDICRQRRPGARRLPVYHGTCRSSLILSRRPSLDLLRQQLLHCTCTQGRPRQRECGAPGGARRTQPTCLCRVSCGRPGWRS